MWYSATNGSDSSPADADAAVRILAVRTRAVHLYDYEHCHRQTKSKVYEIPIRKSDTSSNGCSALYTVMQFEDDMIVNV